MATRGPAATESARFSKLCANLEEQNACPDMTRKGHIFVKNLKKTRMCSHYLQGKCGLGANCKFAHSESELCTAPNWCKTSLCVNFMNGTCNKDNCTFAHGKEELLNSPSYKKAMCNFYRQGKCRNGSSCRFVHGLSELCGDIEPSEEIPQKPPMCNFYRGGKCRNGSSCRFVHIEPAEEIPKKPWRSTSPTVDCDASTEAPSESTDVSAAEAKPMPDELLFRMMAGRGSAPLDQQAKSMSLAIEQLQAKLVQVQARQGEDSSRLENVTLKNQVKELQYAINELSKQIKGSDDHPMKVSPKVSAKVSAKRPYHFDNSVALGVLVLAAILMVEVAISRIL